VLALEPDVLVAILRTPASHPLWMFAFVLLVTTD
jgi:hypothetical protein